MTDETLFAEALEKGTAAERARYLDAACDGPEQRARLDSLLAAHDRAGSFLGRPAVASDPGGEVTRTAAPDNAVTRTTDPDAPADDADATAFLAPPGRPDSLGRIGHYEVLAVLGQGGFGIVYRAFDTVLQRVVAVKVLAPHMAATSPARKRFLREARSAAVIQHEHVVRIHETGETPLPYLVMEFVPGDTLQQRMDRTGPLEVAEVLKFARQIAAGLAAAHAKGLIHRDIKPSNVLIDAGPQQAKITDFGLARAADDASLTRSGTVAGTPMYMAPEQARGEALDQRADLFSLGSVMYALLTGRPPFRAPNTPAVLKRVAEDDPRPIREVTPEVPEWVCRIVGKLHAKNPADRFQTAAEVADLLADCERQLAERKELTDYSRIPGGKPTGQSRRWSRRRVRVVGGLVALTALLYIALWAGPFAYRHAANRGTLDILPADGLVSVIVLQNDEGDLVTDKLHTPVTDWLGMKEKSHSLTLTPGKYQLNVGTFPMGTEVSRWEVTTAGLFGRRTVEVPVLRTSAIIPVGRGERVTVRPKMVTGTRPPPAAPPAVAGFAPLFNGKDLSGWKEFSKWSGGWTVEDGLLVGKGAAHLRTDRNDYGNCLLRAEMCVSGEVGIFFRSPPDPAVTPTGWVASLSSFGLWHAHTGWKLMASAKGGVPQNTWFTLELSVRDDRLKIEIDGKPAFESPFDNSALKNGQLALHVYDRSEARFRKIEIKELPATARQPGGSAPQSDADRLKGEWLVVSATSGGKTITPKAGDEPVFDFGPKEFGITIPADGRRVSGSYRLDPARGELSLQDPRTGPLFLPIGYRFDGDRLRLTPPAGAFDDLVATDRIRSLNNLKQLTIAAHNYHDSTSTFPPAGLPAPTGNDLTPRLSWRVALLPFIEEEALYRQFKLDESWDSEHNKRLIEKMPKMFATPGVKAPPGHTHYRAFTGPGTALEPGRNPRQGPKIPVDFTDGTSNTLLLVEADEPTVWTKPDDLPFDPKKPLPKLREVDGGVNVAFADGSAFTLKLPLKDGVLRAMVTRTDGEAVSAWELPRVTAGKDAVVLECVRKGAAQAPPELPAVKSPPAVPAKAADVLPFLAGTWKAEWEELDPKLPPEQATGGGALACDFVAGGKFLRTRSVLGRRNNEEALVLQAYDPAAGALRVWQARSSGFTSGPSVAAFNPDNRSLTWAYPNPAGKPSNQQLTFVDGDTASYQLHNLEENSNITRVGTIRLTRATSIPLPPPLPTDSKRPDEMSVLDRLAGEWKADIAVKPAGGSAVAEAWRTTARSVLAGRFVEMVGTRHDAAASDYALVWYDPAAKCYRQWYFNSDGHTLALTGTWDEAANILSWESADKLKTRRWTFKGDAREFRHAATDGKGQVVSEATGESRRVAADKK